MPNESLSIYLTAVDGMSPVLASITDKTKALDKESQELQQTYEALQKANMGLIERKTALQNQLKSVNEEVKAASKSFKELGDEASSDALNKATEKQQTLKDQIAATTKALQENQKTYKENIETIRKGALSSPGVDDDGSGVSALGSILGGLGIGQQLSSLTQSAAGTLLTSTYGSEVGGLVSGAMSSAISGGSLGTAIAPGIGTAIGAALGGLTGLYGSAIEQWASKDEAFKSYYGGLYDDVSGRSRETISAGSTTAGSREQTRIAFEQKLGGEQQAADYLARVEEMAANTNYEYDEIVGYTKSLLNTYDAGRVLDVLQTLSDASGGLGLDSSDVSNLIQGLYMLRSSDTASSQYLKSFTTRGVDTNQAIADFLNAQAGWEQYGKNDVTELISDGKVSGEDAAQAILDYIDNNYGGLSILQSETYDAMVDNLGDITTSLQALGGEAYNTLRKEGVESEMNALGGELGDAIGEINAIMGENQARKENLQEQYLREALEAVLLGKEGSVFNEAEQEALAELSAQYADWRAQYEESGRTDAEAAAQMERLYETAQALGQSYFDNSDFVKMLNDTELDEIQAILDATAGLDNATQASYYLAEQLSKGRAGITVSISSSGGGIVGPYQDDGGNWHSLGSSEDGPSIWDVDPSSHAFGLSRVPRDDYPALLHEGERVLTASEARVQDAAQAAPAPIQLTITGNSFTGTPEEMADQLAAIIVRKLEQAAVAAAPK